MIFLWIFGNNIEDRLGRIWFLLFYLVGGDRGRHLAGPRSTRRRRPDDRRVRRDRGRPRRVPRALPGRADPVARVPRLLLPAASRSRPSSSSGSGSSSSWSTGSRRSGSPARRAASPSSPTSAGSSPASAIGPARPGDRSSGVGELSGLPRARRGIIAAMASEDPPGDGLVEMVVESVRVHMLSSRHVVILKETERDRYLPIWIGPWEASAIAMRLQGLTAGAAADPRPLRGGARGARCARRPGDHLDAGRGDVPRPPPPRARRHRSSRSTRGRPTRWPSRSGPAAGSSRPRRSSSRRRSAPTRRSEDERGQPTRIAARVDRRADRRPAARRVPRLRELARRRPGHRRGAARQLTGLSPTATAGDRSAWITGVPRRSARARFDHIRSRSGQKSRTARKITLGLAPVGEPAVRG